MMKRLAKNRKYQTGRVVASWLLVLLVVCAIVGI